MAAMKPTCLVITLILLSTNALASDGQTVATWNFGAEEPTLLKLHGNVQRDQIGPRPPEFPDFADDNTAITFNAKGYLSFSDPGQSSDFDFANGDEITLEAWVNVQSTGNTSPMYVIGKGRTGAKGFARDNQNWAMRVVMQKETAKVSFLFATPVGSGGGGSHWHRWTSAAGFHTATGWHHIAVAYRFGDPKSVRGWIDGQPTEGDWDMGGATKAAPVVDDDAIWIGSSQGGSSGNSFRGSIDAVAIHRSLLSSDVIASRFNRVGGPRVVAPKPEVMPEMEVPPGTVLLTFSEGLASNARWLREGEADPVERDRLIGDQFLLSRVPIAYDDWGIRRAWKSPLHVAMASDVALPPGKHRVLIRARSLGRLWVDGKVIARTIKNPHKRSNLEPIVPIAAPPAPGGRPVAFPQQEVISELEVSGPAESHRVVFEFVVGGKDYRTETGEVVVAIQYDSAGPFFVLQGEHQNASPLPLTDAAIEPVLSRLSHAIDRHDTDHRRRLASSQDQFWQRRHELAREHLRADQSDGQGPTSIDGYIDAKIESAVTRLQSDDLDAARDFHATVLPLLREKCFRCHGEKEQGGLRLNSREAALQKGESDEFAVVPGDPEASELMVRVLSGDMPPSDEMLTKQETDLLAKWIKAGAEWPDPPIDPETIRLSDSISDAQFIRRVYLDTVGLPPQQATVVRFLSDSDPRKRQQLVDRMLDDPRLADHWVSFWMDLLAENPTLLNPSLNSTGPFRWFLHDALSDGKSLDRMVTELIQMRGSAADGGSAGFGLAAENDSPMAAKSHILAAGLLGIELQCARCHDSPYHSTTQEELYSLAAMLERKQLAPPKTSRVPDAFFENQTRESLIQVTLKPDQQVGPAWPFERFTGVADTDKVDQLMRTPDDSRERLAALITSPENDRFPQVMVNHLWERLVGAGIVEPVHDWEGQSASHPKLLAWLADELVRNDYDARHVMRLIMNSAVYQRAGKGNNLAASPQQRFFAAPDPRRLTAEQVVDSLHTATSTSIDSEELTFVHDGVHPMNRRLTLGVPRRAWMFASLNNERDRPSLSLPRAQAVVDVLEAFGWNGSRQKPIAKRESDPNVLQPGILANGDLTMRLTRASQNSVLAQLALDAKSPNDLVEALFLRFLSRYPTATEAKELVGELAPGFEHRRVAEDKVQWARPDAPLPQVTWTNHLLPEANEIQLEVQRRVRRGPPADPRINPDWREAYEDAVWSLVNSREFAWMP